MNSAQSDIVVGRHTNDEITQSSIADSADLLASVPNFFNPRKEAYVGKQKLVEKESKGSAIAETTYDCAESLSARFGQDSSMRQP
jgi:hypothetical protein